MNEDWKSVNLDEVAEIGAGNSAPQDKSLYVDGTFPFVRTADVGQVGIGTITSVKDRLNENGTHKLRLVKRDTILIPKSGASTFCNHRVMMGFDGYVASHLATVAVREAIADPHFVLYYLTTVMAQDLIQDHKYPSLNLPVIKSISVPLPPLAEQKRIVAILDEAFGAIAKAKENAERNLANAKELFESYLNKVFTEKGEGWEEKTLADVASSFGRGKSRHRPRNDESLYGGKFPFIQTGEIRKANHFITEYSKTYNEKGLAQSKLWPVGTLCITIAANIAETAILTFDACIPDSVIGLVCDTQKANVDFVEYLLQHFKSVLQAEGKGSAQDNINMGTFENMAFPFPSVSEQERIVRELNAIAGSCSNVSPIYEQKLSDLDELKQSILQKAFTGQLTSKSTELEAVG